MPVRARARRSIALATSSVVAVCVSAPAQVVEETSGHDRVRSRSTEPPARAHHRLVSHPDGRILLVGGSTRLDTGYAWFDDVWSREAGTGTWSRVDGLPFRRSSHALAYDRARGEVVLLGGIGRSGDPAGGTVWVGDGRGWESRAELADEGWAEPAACYDRSRKRVVVFGGWDGANEFRGDTWEWDGREMVRVSTAGPAARAGHEIAWDPVSRRCILFGGRGDAGFLTDTWAWDGDAWRILTEEGPPARWFFGLATADAWGTVVLFGGATAAGDLADTWTWDGSSWTRVDATGPPPRGMSRIAFDGERIVLFGGRQRSDGDPPFTDLSDTWEFDGERWSRR